MNKEKSEDLMKSLAMVLDKDLSNEEDRLEIESMINSDISKSEAEEEEEDEEYDEEESLKKAMDEATKAYDSFKNKKKVVEKSETEDLEKSTEDSIGQHHDSDLLAKSIGILIGKQKEEVNEKIDEIQKSIADQMSVIADSVAKMSEEIDKIGRNTPPSKTYQGDNSVIIEKAQGGIKQGNDVYYSQKIHRENIGESLLEIIESKDGSELAKSLNNDLSNFIAGSGELSEKAKQILHKEKGIIVT